MKPKELSKYILYFLLLICLFVGGLFFVGGKVESADGVSVPVYTNMYLIFVVFFVGLTLLLTLAGAFYDLSKRFKRSPKEGVRSIAGFFILGAILFICWFLGNGSLLTLESYDGTYNTPSWLKITDMFLNSLYLLISGAVLLIVGFYVARKIR